MMRLFILVLMLGSAILPDSARTPLLTNGSYRAALR